VPEAPPSLPLSVWPTAQQPAARQRAGRYLQASTAHPAKMLPEIARTAIQRYSQPGELVLDPMCGIGTTLVEAIHLGRDALGVEREPRWAELARANLAHAAAQGATGTGTVATGDARQLLDLVDAPLRGRVALVVTSPPYGPSVHGQVDARPGRVVKYDNRYDEPGSSGRGNLARANDQALLDAIGQILGACHTLLRPGGVVVLTARPWRRRGLLVDFPGALVRAGERAGLACFERNVALLVGLAGDRLVGRPSFFQLDRVRKARAAGVPLRVIAHEDVLVFIRSPTRTIPRPAAHHDRTPMRPGRACTAPSARPRSGAAGRPEPPGTAVQRPLATRRPHRARDHAAIRPQGVPMPGYYQHNPDPARAELLHHLAEQGWGNESIDAGTDDGYEATLVVVEPAERQELSEAFDREVPPGNFLVTHDPRGAVTLHEYATASRARQAFTDLATAATPGPDDGTVTATGPPGSPYAVALAGRRVGSATSIQQAVAMLGDAMDAEQDWPDAWHVSDHGIAHRIDPGHQ